MITMKITVNLPFVQERSSPRLKKSKESCSAPCRPKLPVTAGTTLSNDFPQRKFSHPPNQAAVQVSLGPKEGRFGLWVLSVSHPLFYIPT